MFKAGTLLILDSGEYSSTDYAGPFRVVRDLDKTKAYGEFMAQAPDYERTSEEAFIAWLARAGYIEDFDVEHWYLGDYGLRPLDFEWHTDDEGNRWPEKTFEAESREEREATVQQMRLVAEYEAQHGIGSYAEYLKNTPNLTTATITDFKMINVLESLPIKEPN